jgi:hypothetical protein
MRSYFLYSFAFLIILSACSKPDPQNQEKIQGKKNAFKEVQLDLTTPDKALKSYWSVIDAAVYNEKSVKDKYSSELSSAYSQLALVQSKTIYEERYSNSRPIETFSRDIIEVKVESESRAVIETLIKNTTPNPKGAELADFQKESREDGVRYKYVLEKNKNAWIVIEIWSWWEYSSKWNKYLPSDKPEVFYLAYP